MAKLCYMTNNVMITKKEEANYTKRIEIKLVFLFHLLK